MRRLTFYELKNQNIWSRNFASARRRAVVMLCLGIPALHARQQGCQQAQKCAPAVVREKPTPLPPAETCCPVDPKEVKKAKKEADHAAHEAAEACKRQQAAVQKAQHEMDEARARAQDEIDKANAHLEHERSEYVDATAKLESLTGSSSEAVAEVKTEPPIEYRTQSEPEPVQAPIVESTPPPTYQETIAILEATPAPTPMPDPIPEPRRTQLPRTASSLELIGLLGLVSMSGG
jgi:hypothetical protein